MSKTPDDWLKIRDEHLAKGDLVKAKYAERKAVTMHLKVLEQFERLRESPAQRILRRLGWK